LLVVRQQMMQFLMSRLQASAISWSVLLRLQEFAWIADRDRAREGVFRHELLAPKR
jgi:hypothetical protein